jgi:hypothetical protein
MPQPPKDVVFDPADLTLLREVLRVVHDNYEVMDESALGCKQADIRIFQDKLARGHDTPEGVSVTMTLQDLLQLGIICIMASNFAEELRFPQPNAEEIIDALSERLDVLEERHFESVPRAPRIGSRRNDD